MSSHPIRSLEASHSLPPSRKLILSVDDEPAILYTRKTILETNGYRVISAPDGEEALEFFDAYPDIALVLLDYAMPELDGGEVARQMKMRRPSVPIIMVSTHEALLEKMPVTWVDLVIAKGSGPAYLLERINQFLESTPSLAEPRKSHHPPHH